MNLGQFMSSLRGALLGGQENDIAHHKLFPTTMELAPKRLYTVITSIYTFMLALFGLLILAPLMLTIAVAVKLSSPGPAFYRGLRVGQNKVPFNILKFRTMKVGSEAKIGKRLVQQDEDHYTPIGRFLRKYRLDELPQLFNVLKRDMNLVGPRPVRPIFLEDHIQKIPGYERRFFVRPGITGQAQVRGGYYTSPRHKLFYDCLYIARRTVLFDIQLVVLTFARVMTRIFTTTLLLGWLIMMVLVAPPEVNAAMTLSLGGVTLNILYLVPTLIAGLHLAHRRIEQRRVVALRTPGDLPLIALLTWSTLIIPLSPDPVGALRGVGWWTCNGVVIFYLVLNSRMVTDRRDSLIAVLIFGTTVVGLTDVLPQVFEWVNTQEFSRLKSQKFSPILLSAIVVLSLPWSLSRSLATPRGWIRNLYTLATFSLMITAILTLSRSGLIATACAGVFVLWPLKRRWAIGSVAVIGIVIGALGMSGDRRMQPSPTLQEFSQTTARQSKVISRLHDVPQVKPYHWATGIGARVMGRLARNEKYKAQRPSLILSNMYLTVLVDQGVIGLLFFVLFMIRSYTHIARHLDRLSDEHANRDLRAALGGLSGCGFLFFFSDGLYQLPLIITYFAALGLAVGLASQYGPQSRKVYRIIQYRHQL